MPKTPRLLYAGSPVAPIWRKMTPVTLEAPAPQIERPTATVAPTPVIGAAAMGAIEINVGNTRVRIEGSPNEGTLRLVLRMLRNTPESAA
ncbi:hypothetical protein [Burkholderia thailandensis]|uniref:hypothetical protein n=2 Tax=Burkholderia thailandensis TaxID=57975 RepID=UPI0020129875|nr:hypothetical protein [Burkholderia thailandensis]